MRRLLSKLKLYAKFLKLSNYDKADFEWWWRRNFIDPAPHFVKMNILTSDPNIDVWIETGTFLGNTTEVLARSCPKVFSIEPDEKLADAATEKFASNSNVVILKGLSENLLGKILENEKDLSSKTVAFWLDGHFSDGVTHRGPLETPVVRELEIIKPYVRATGRLLIYVDDFRCFVRGEKDYPTPNYLVEWAAANGFYWDVQHDIFIMKNG